MKRIILSILAVAALASCSKTESAYVDLDQEIKLNPVTAMTTKANDVTKPGAIDGTKYPTTEEFDVYAYWKNEPAGVKFYDGVTTYLAGEGSGVEFNNKGLYWGGTTTYYWPKNGSLRFAAYSPASLDIVHELGEDTDTYTVAYEQSNYTNATIDMLLAPTTPSYTAETATENVSVVFEHALSWITVKVKAANPEAAAAFKIYSLTIDDVYTTADLEANMLDGIQYAEWSNQDAALDYSVYNSTEGKVITTNPAILEDTENGTVVIPQVPTTLTIKFQQNTLADEVMEVVVPMELDDETNNKWEPGKHYIYTVIFDLDEILINPSVADWEDVVVEDKEAGDEGQIATVSTLKELEDALAAEVPEIELTSNIKLTSELAVNYSVAFVGGGFTGKSIAVTGPVVSFENVAFANATGNKESSVYVRNGNTNVTFQNCTFDNYKWEAIQYTSEDGLWVCVDNCTFNAAAHRDLHLEVDNPSKAEVKITNNQFNGTDEDSYVTVYGFDQERMILADNVTEEPANTTNVWISDLFDWNSLTLRGFVKPTSETPEATLTQSMILGDNFTVPSLNLAGNDLDGAGYTLTMEKGTAKTFVSTGAGHITNLNVLGYNTRNNNNAVTYGIYLTNITGDVVLNNVTSTDFAYSLNAQGGSATSYTLTVVNSVLEGWCSYSSIFASVKFIGTNFKIGDYFANEDPSTLNPWNCTIKPYTTTTLENCSFEKGFNVDLSKLPSGATVTMTNCTVDGVVLTAENVADYLTGDVAGLTF